LHQVPPLACVIFDLDGTLTRTNELIFASFNHVARTYLGTTMTPAEIIGLFGPPEEGGLKRLVGEERAEKAMGDLCRFYADHHSRLATLHDGVVDVLEYLKGRGVRLAVFTGKGRTTATITLDAFGIAGYFDRVVSGSDVTHHKPHPEGINTVIGDFGLDAASVLMVGDALSDVKASRAAGVRIAAALWDSYDRERMIQAGTDVVFSTVSDMLTWFRSTLDGRE